MTFSILLPRENIPKDKTMTKPLCNFMINYIYKKMQVKSSSILKV